MLAALMDKRIRIETKTKTKNSFGAPEESWTTLKTTWANKKHLAGDKTFNDGDISTYSVQFRLRYDTDINMDCRIVEGSEIYEIKEIEEVGRKKELLIRTERNGG